MAQHHNLVPIGKIPGIRAGMVNMLVSSAALQ